MRGQLFAQEQGWTSVPLNSVTAGRPGRLNKYWFPQFGISVADNADDPMEGQTFLHRVILYAFIGIRNLLLFQCQQLRQLLQPAPDAVPHTAAVSALDPGDLSHSHAQVEPGVDAPGLDGRQLH